MLYEKGAKSLWGISLKEKLDAITGNKAPFVFRVGLSVIILASLAVLYATPAWASPLYFKVTNVSGSYDYHAHYTDGNPPEQYDGHDQFTVSPGTDPNSDYDGQINDYGEGLIGVYTHENGSHQWTTTSDGKVVDQCSDKIDRESFFWVWIEHAAGAPNATVSFDPLRRGDGCQTNGVYDDPYWQQRIKTTVAWSKFTGSSPFTISVSKKFSSVPGFVVNRVQSVTLKPLAKELNVSASRERVCPNQGVTFTARNKSGSLVKANWSGGGNPSTGSGDHFTTRYSKPGQKTVTARRSTVTDSKTIKVMRPSGVWWTSQYPTSTSTADLTPAFRTDVDNFLGALHNAGASVSISATYRPPERAYLMHYSWDIAHGTIEPGKVPPMKGVDICWVHRNSNGKPDKQASIQAAKRMVGAYHIKYRPSLKSRHTERRAIDMSISWSGTLKIKNASGDLIKIASTPRTGAGNHDLWRVGKSYGVIKLASDPPHWSDDGH